MNPKLLTESCGFTCSQNAFLKISASNPRQINARISGKYVLTNQARCKTAVSLPCPFLTAQSGGTAPVPCRLSSLDALQWMQPAGKVKIRSFPVLTSDSMAICPHSMETGMIKPRFPTGIAVLKTIASVPKVSGDLPGETAGISASASPAGTSAMTSETKSAEKQTAQAESTTLAKSDEVITQEETFASNCRCDYSSCPEREQCEYYNTQVFIDNNSAKLSNRFKSERSAEWNAYLQMHEEKNAESTEGNWRIAAHHIISGNLVLLMRDESGCLLYGDIVKLANYFGYDVNNALNCIMLPTNEANFGAQESIQKIASAYSVMFWMKRQWHVGGHKYSLTKETLENLNAYYQRNPDKYPVPGNPSFFSNYQTAMKEEMDKLQNSIRDQCWKKNYAYKKQRFIESMNSISAKVERKLLDFAKDPRNSFPFFVSKVAVEYAYNIPTTAKLIVLYEDGNTLKAKKYRVERYIKNNGSIFFNEKGEITVSDDSEFVLFCENVLYFLSDSRIGCEMPFVPDMTDPYVLRKADIGESDPGYFLQTHCNEIIAFIQQNPITNQPAAKIVRHRLDGLAMRKRRES